MTDQLIFNSGFFITPNDIFELEELSMKEKLVFVYLCRCSNNGSSAFPSYNTIGKKCSVSRMTAIDAVKGLVQKGIIQKTERIENGENTSNTYRILWGSQKFVPPLVQNFDQGGTKSGPYKELPINNSPIKKKPLPSKLDDMVPQIIEYLNQQAGKNFSSKTKESVKFIFGRLNEGRTFEDFKHVIDVKVSQWKYDDEMDKCLRPSTLFRPGNFEAYLQERIKEKSAKPAARRDKLPFEPDYKDLPQPPDMM